MKIEFPNSIETYIEAKNAYDVSAILACFHESALVYDESKAHHGKLEIKAWIEETIRKYQDQLRPIRVAEKEGELVLTAEISGTFEGSPIELDFYFTIEGDKIAALSIQ